jgi:hypothetical protein
VRLLSAVARDRRATAYTGLVTAALTAVAIAAAVVVAPSWWPLPSPYETVGRLTGHLKDLVGDLR